MRNYTITEHAPPRFEGDFKLEPEKAEDPTEQVFLEAIRSATEALAKDEETDKEKNANLPEAMRAKRKEVRKSAAAGLRGIATKVIDEKMSLNEAVQAIDDELEQYKSNLPNFAIRDAESPVVKKEFRIAMAEGYEPPEEDQRFLTNLEVLLEEISSDAKQEPIARISQAVIGQRTRLRERLVDELRESAQTFCASGWSDSDDVLVQTGRYRSERDRLSGKLFSVVGLSEEETNRSIDQRIVGVRIELTEGLPPPQDKPTPEQEELFTQLNKTATVINLVCERMKEESKGWWASVSSDVTSERASRILHEYTDKLCGVAVVGLEQPHTTIAKVALNELRSEFTAQEAGRIKNRYVRKLGVAAGIFAAIFITAYVAIYYSKWPWGELHSSFLLAAAGAAVGTWISFSVRQVTLSFDDLLLTEDNSLDPTFRVLFVIALTWTACLLFWTGVFNLEIGSLRTSADALQKTGAVALLIGILCGLSERALATAISGRAAAFAQGLSGGR